MKLTSLVVIVLAVFSSILSAQNRSLPNVNIKTLEGQTISVPTLGASGKITVISFWATWCTPCKKELDAVAEVYDEWKEKYDIELIAVTIDDARSLPKVKPMVAEKGWEFTILSDVNKDMMNALNFQNVPFTFLIDQNGNIVYQHSGYIPGDENSLEEEIAKLAK
jgi:thiol-disulfide isomerase/thioredoxin